MDLSQILPKNASWLQLFAAVAVIVVCWVVSRYARRGVLALAARTPGISKTLGDSAARITGYIVVLLGIGIALAIMGANVQPLLALVLVVGVVLVLVLRGVADNFAASVIIQTRHPLILGDEVQIKGLDGELLTGTVTALETRTVILRTYDGRTVHVPNAKLTEDLIINDSTHGSRRSAVHARIQRGDAIVADLLRTVRDAAATAAGVHAEPAVNVLLESLSPQRVTVLVQFWHGSSSGAGTAAAVVAAVASALEDAGHPVTVTSTAAASPVATPDSV